MTGKWYPCLIKGRTDLPSFILFPHLIYLIYLMYLVYSIYSTLSYQALSTLTGLWVFTQSTKFVETSVSLSQSVGNLGKKERRLLDEMLFHLNFFNTCLLVWFSVALDNLRTLYWIWNIFFHKLSRQTPPHQVANCQWMTRNYHSLWENHRKKWKWNNTKGKLGYSPTFQTSRDLDDKLCPDPP